MRMHIASAPRALLGVTLLLLLALQGCAGWRAGGRSGAPAGRPVAAEGEKEGQVHIVAAGETLYAIAKRYGVDPNRLARENGIDDPTTLRIGQRLAIPSTSASREPAAPATPTPDARPGVAPRLGWPAQGVLYAKFGKRGDAVHEGIDIAAPEGTAIVAAGDGTVLFAGEQKGYGLMIIIQHKDDLITLYATNRELLVKEGARVARGQLIARMGGETQSNGPRLHFEVREARVARDPLLYLPPPR